MVVKVNMEHDLCVEQSRKSKNYTLLYYYLLINTLCYFLLITHCDSPVDPVCRVVHSGGQLVHDSAVS